MLRIAVVVAFCLWGATQWWTNRPVGQPSGVLAPEPPVQIGVKDVRWFDRGNYQITPLANFEIKARILGRENYLFDAGAELVPVDLALGWGPMSDSGVLEHIDISQSGRFYFWQVKQFPIPRRDIETHSANMHLIPANERIEAILNDTREGQVVAMRGYLVRADRADGWAWQSSLTREDTGAGACELIWVEELAIL